VKIVRVRLPGEEIAYGAVEPEGIRIHQGTPFVAWEPTEALVPFAEAHLLAPVFPTKVVCVGRNYAEHAAEHGVEVPDEPVIFLKPSTAVIGPGAAIVIPPGAGEVHHEAAINLRDPLAMDTQTRSVQRRRGRRVRQGLPDAVSEVGVPAE